MTVVVAVLVVAQIVGARGLASTLHAATLRWSLLPAAGASVGADLTMAFVTGDSFRPLVGALGLGLVAVLLGQVVRRDRREVIPSVAAGCGTLLAVVPAATLVGLDGLPSGLRPVIAVAAAALIGALPLPFPHDPSTNAWPVPPNRPWIMPLVVVAVRVATGTLAAALICTHSSLVEPFDGVLIGLSATLAAVTGARALKPSYAMMVAPVLVGITAGAIVGRGILG